MSALDALISDDFSGLIDRIPRMRGHQVLEAREDETHVTFHYSGVVYRVRTPAVERARVLDEAGFQIRKNWAKRGRPPIYGDGLMYDLVVLEDESVIRTRRRRQRLWHCRNEYGNNRSWSVHVMLGPGQDVTPGQRQKIFQVFDAIRADDDIPRQNVVAHCEWPVGDGLPVLRPFYHMEPGQSECPGRVLWSIVGDYRAHADAPREWQMRVVDPCSTDPDDNFAAVRTARSRTAPPARINDQEVRLAPGTLVIVDNLTDGWYHLAPNNPAGGAIGFLDKSLLEPPR